MSGSPISDESSGRGSVFLVYGLYLARFFTGITILAGVIVAYVLKGSSTGLNRLHLRWLVRLFWYDIIIIILTVILFAGCLFIAPSDSGSRQFIFLIPIVLFTLWNIFFFVALLYGVRALSQGRDPVSLRFQFLEK